MIDFIGYSFIITWIMLWWLGYFIIGAVVDIKEELEQIKNLLEDERETID